MNAVILSARRYRLRPLTYAVRSLIPVLNRPSHLPPHRQPPHQTSTIVLAAAASEHRIEEALGDGRDLGVRLSYCYESNPGSGSP